jgi:hypothetical protein
MNAAGEPATIALIAFEALPVAQRDPKQRDRSAYLAHRVRVSYQPASLRRFGIISSELHSRYKVHELFSARLPLARELEARLEADVESRDVDA